MAKGKPRDPRKEQLWRPRIAAWRASGLTVRAFCERRRLAEPSFYAWRRELDQRPAPAATFVPVRVVPDEARAPAGVVEVLLPGRRTVRVEPRGDAPRGTFEAAPDLALAV